MFVIKEWGKEGLIDVTFIENFSEVMTTAMDIDISGQGLQIFMIKYNEKGMIEEIEIWDNRWG